MLNLLSKYVVVILGTLVSVLLIVSALGYWRMSMMQSTIDKQNVELGVVAAMSQAQDVRVVESKTIEEKIKVVTNEKLKVVKEYIYDNNKTECDNAINLMRSTF